MKDFWDRWSSVCRWALFVLFSFSSAGAPLFIENVGQFDQRALFQVWGAGQTLWIASDAIWITLVEPREPLKPWENLTLFPSWDHEEAPRRVVNIRISFPGANPKVHLEPFGRLNTTVSYFIGNDPAKWRTEVPVWSGVLYRELYPGVDLKVFREGGRWNWRWLTQKPESLVPVKMRIEGAERVEILSSGDVLCVHTALGNFLLPLPLVGTPALPRPKLEAKGEVFEVHFPWASTVKASFEPKAEGANGLLYSTFLGGTNDDYWGHGVVVDAAGAVYVTGWTSSSDFPTTSGAFDTTHHGHDDVFVIKLSQAGDNLVYATFLGGARWDWSFAIAVDTDGAAYVTGVTGSSDFPVTPGAFDTTHGGFDDAFVVKLGPSGTTLDYATFLGGSGWDRAFSIVIDSSRAAYITGEAIYSPDFPTTPDAFDTSHDLWDAFVAKLNPSGTELVYGTFLGGSGLDQGTAITIDASGTAYIAGRTTSSDFPTTPGSFDTTFNGDEDVFVAKLSPSGKDLIYATFLGGNGRDFSIGIAVDANGCAYVSGTTESFDFPTTMGAFDATFNGNYDAFVVKLTPDGANLAYATFLGGSEEDVGAEIAVDQNAVAYITGYTFSPSFPTSPDAFDPTHNGLCDAFVVKLNESGTEILYATFIGGSNLDQGVSIAVQSGVLHISGATASPDFPITLNAFDNTHNGGFDTFIVKITVKVLLAQGYIEGQVKDASTGRGIPNAKVEASGPVIVSTLTDSDGNFSLSLPPSTYDLMAYATGYRTQVQPNISVDVNQTVLVNFSLAPIPLIIHGPNPVPPEGCIFWLALPPDAVLATLKIYAVDGALLVTIPLDPKADRYPPTGRWIPQDSGGRLLGTGLYLYLVEIQHSDGHVTYSPVQKMVIKR